MESLRSLLAEASGTGSTQIDIAALELAQIEFPTLPVEPFLEILDSHARELAALLRPGASGEQFVETANQYFFETLGFRGERDNYYHPRNSCLNEVLTARTGIPITLAVVYMEVARRLGRPVSGVGMPGHFLAKYDAPGYSCFIDCFGGRVVSFEECRELALGTSKIDIFAVPATLAPVSKRQILLRMLNNLRGAYRRTEEHNKAIAVLDLLLEAAPGAEEYKQRGALHLHLGRTREALADWERYLSLARRDPDVPVIEEQVRRLRGSAWRTARQQG